ncbi:fibronectin type III domain-containing protein [Actinotalea sp. K2]|uniref:fibronectin type III domain-containing protein n=1 Tax=Actinotalea sp. K2 TaxID=2939438 RepID=UPI002017BD8F|nr:fibronectin type III domain-containing protein [Actinotalea sp. K2]MCL3862968.1 fibronectin type III domain-containing protein [Actinotalea sp. K2]
MRRTIPARRGAATLTLAAVLAALPGAAHAQADLSPEPSSPFVVLAASGAGPAVAAELDALGATPEESFQDVIEGFSVDLTDAQAQALSASTSVVDISPEELFWPTEEQMITPGYTHRTSLWNLDRIDQAALPLDGYYTYPNNAGQGVPIYIVDTGVGPHHQINGYLAPGFTSITDGLGTADCHGHGTHVAGTASGTWYAVAKQAPLVPVRVLPCEGPGTSTSVLAGLDWIAATHPAGTPGVVNMSLGGPSSPSLNQAVAGLIAKGLTVVAAAGNDAGDACELSPASAPDALTVAASDVTDSRADFSNTGPCVDLFAPGVEVRSANVGAVNIVMSGTSMAAPHVAGAAALYLSHYPTATPAQVSTAIMGATQPVIIDPGPSTTNRLLNTRVLHTPEPPTGVRSAGATPTSLTLTWDAPVTGTSAVSYQVSYTGPDMARKTLVATTSTSQVLANLAPLTSYAVSVVSINEFGTSAPSTPATLQTAHPPVPPSVPQGLTAQAVTGRSAQVLWSAPATALTPVTAYQVQTSTNGTTWTTRPGVPADGTSAQLATLAPATRYHVRVRAVAGDLPGPWTPTLTFTTLDVVGAPQELKVTATTSTSTTLTWRAPADPPAPLTGYVVERWAEAARGDAATWVTVARPSATTTRVTLTGLERDRSYRLRVAAVTATGLGDWSASVSVTTVSRTGQYVTAVYLSLFNRPVDPVGRATWTQKLDSGTPRMAVADAITSSEEYRSTLIRQSYRAYLGRAPDPVGLRNWLTHMNRGMTIQEMEGGFVASPEYYARAGGTRSGWVATLYRDVLGRSASPAEVDRWVAQLSRGTSREQVARGFLLSAEHLSSVLDGHYRHLLGRGLDPTGKASWVSAIQRGTRIEVVIGGIIASNEYYSKNT